MTKIEAAAMEKEFENELRGKRKLERPMIMAAFYKACLAAATVDESAAGDPAEEMAKP